MALAAKGELGGLTLFSVDAVHIEVNTVGMKHFSVDAVDNKANTVGINTL